MDTLYNIPSTLEDSLIKLFEDTQYSMALKESSDKLSSICNNRVVLPINDCCLKVCPNCSSFIKEYFDQCPKCGYKHLHKQPKPVDQFSYPLRVKQSINYNYLFLYKELCRYSSNTEMNIKAINSWVQGKYPTNLLLDILFCKALYHLRFRVTGFKWCPYYYKDGEPKVKKDALQDWFQLKYSKKKWYLIYQGIKTKYE
jgi:hypothetical protein